MSTSAPQTRPAGPPPSWAFFSLFVAGWVVVDQITKYLALAKLTEVFALARAETFAERLSVFFSARPPGPVAHAPTVVVPAFWSFFYTENRGALGSLGARMPEAMRVPVFTVVTIVAFAAIAVYYRKLEPDKRILRWALALLGGGALGNLVDRLARGYVIDFVDWHLNDPAWLHPARHWFTFNWADVGITLGVSLVLLDSLLSTLAARRATRETKARKTG